MVIAGVSLAEGDVSNASNSGTYEAGAFNFTENSTQDVSSDISGNAVVHGDTSANVAGNQNNCYEIGSCINGDNGGVIQTLTAGSGNILNGGDLGGHFVTLEVPVMTYEEQYKTVTDGSGITSQVSTGFMKVQAKYTQADVDAGAKDELGNFG